MTIDVAIVKTTDMVTVADGYDAMRVFLETVETPTVTKPTVDSATLRERGFS